MLKYPGKLVNSICEQMRKNSGEFTLSAVDRARLRRALARSADDDQKIAEWKEGER